MFEALLAGIGSLLWGDAIGKMAGEREAGGAGLLGNGEIRVAGQQREDFDEIYAVGLQAADSLALTMSH